MLRSLLVSCTGDIKSTKYIKFFLDEMQIQNTTNFMTSLVALAQDNHCGDGTTWTVVLIFSLLKNA